VTSRCHGVNTSRRNHGGLRRNSKGNDITIFRNFGNYTRKDSVTFQNKLLLQNRYPISLLFQSETQLWAIHYCLLSRAAELHNVVQRHFVTSTSRLLRHGSISRTVSKTPSKCLLSDNQPADGTEDFHIRCLDSKFLVFLKPFSTFPYIYGSDSPGFGSRKREKIFLSVKTVQTSCGAHPAFNSMGAGVHSRGLQRTGHEVDHSPPVSVRGEGVQLYLIRPQSVYRDKFTLIYFQVLPFIVMTNKYEDYTTMKRTALQSSAICVGR
jgi:hypothetical protein